MTFIQALILGIVQGFTEFLPVSSSTHLSIVQRLLGLEGSEGMVYFDLVCHLGTLCAIIVVLWKDVWRVLTSIRLIAIFSLALLPLIPGYLLFKPLRVLLAHDAGFFLLCTSALMFYASRAVLQPLPAIGSPSQPPLKEHLKWRDVLWIGVAQSLALLPGISRSGSTLSVARLLGWEWKEAARFSFLLAIPTVLGGSVLETIRSPHELGNVSGSACLVGLMASFIVGLIAIRMLFWILNRGSLRPFAWYCFVVGAIVLIWLK